MEVKGNSFKWETPILMKTIYFWVAVKKDKCFDLCPCQQDASLVTVALATKAFLEYVFL